MIVLGGRLIIAFYLVAGILILFERRSVSLLLKCNRLNCVSMRGQFKIPRSVISPQLEVNEKGARNLAFMR